MRFSKIKIDAKGGVTLEWTTEAAGETHSHSLKSAATPHPDFVAALADLRTDVITICELPAEYGEDVRVSAVSLSHSDKTGARGAVITALKSVECANSPLVIHTPHLVEALESGDTATATPASGMPKSMTERLDELVVEASAYLTGKRSQVELFDGEKDNGQHELAGVGGGDDTPKRGRRGR